MRRLPLLLPVLVLLGACNSHGGGGEPGEAGVDEGADARAHPGLASGETLRFTGTEPFWGGEVTGTALSYTTPERPEGAAVTVQRFAGNNGFSLSGKLDGRGFDMAVTEQPCSDSMSDRTYPFTVTLQIGAEARGGCGWTDARKFTGPEHP